MAHDMGSGPVASGPDHNPFFFAWIVCAARSGNEARFVNDFRGVRCRPNCKYVPRWGQLSASPKPALTLAAHMP